MTIACSHYTSPVCVCVHSHVHVCVRAYVYVCVHAHVCMCMCVGACMRLCVHVCMTFLVKLCRFSMTSNTVINCTKDIDNSYNFASIIITQIIPYMSFEGRKFHVFIYWNIMYKKLLWLVTLTLYWLLIAFVITIKMQNPQQCFLPCNFSIMQ